MQDLTSFAIGTTRPQPSSPGVPADLDRPCSPDPGDLHRAAHLAQRLVAAGQGVIQRIALIGSRARGDATSVSDFDVMLLTEPRTSRDRWGPRDNSQMCDRLRSTIGPPGLPADLCARSTDEFLGAKGTFGSMEWALARDGVTLYFRPESYAPVARMRPDQVRTACVGTWLGDAVLKLQLALARPVLLPRGCATRSPAEEQASRFALRAIEHATLALFVLRQVPCSTKTIPLAAIADRIERIGEANVAQKLRSAATDGPAVERASAVVSIILERLGQECALSAHVRGLREKFTRPQM